MSPSSQPQPQTARLRRIETAHGAVELLCAGFKGQRFSRHSHSRYPLGVIQSGALCFSYRGKEVVAPAGRVNLANPGEPHCGRALHEEQGWSYRMFYCDSSLMGAAHEELGGARGSLPWFSAGALDDPDLAARLQAIHCILADETRGRLAAESLMLEALTLLISRHADHRPGSRPKTAPHRAVKLCREYLESNYQKDVSLAELAGLCSLSPYHLATLFRKQTGLPPHLYLNQVRIRRAKQLVRQGVELADTALMAGFFDQSHFTRRFKAFTGITPGRYQRAVLNLA